MGTISLEFSIGSDFGVLEGLIQNRRKYSQLLFFFRNDPVVASKGFSFIFLSPKKKSVFRE